MHDLITFLNARLDETQYEAETTLYDRPTTWLAYVLAEIDAKRRILELYEHGTDMPGSYADGWDSAAATAVMHLATAYADHPEYQDTWRP